jgi:hypothetical protein
MNINADILTTGATRVRSNDGLISAWGGEKKNSFGTASRYGEYIAYWSGEVFRLEDLDYNVIWTEWINGDKAAPTGIKFSSSGDAVACFFHFDGVPGMFFCDIEKGSSTIFPCGRPIGYLGDLIISHVSSFMKAFHLLLFP